MLVCSLERLKLIPRKRKKEGKTKAEEEATGLVVMSLSTWFLISTVEDVELCLVAGSLLVVVVVYGRL